MVERNYSEQPTRYTLRLATEKDAPDIVKYLDDGTRPKTVFKRTKVALDTAIENELLWVLTDETGNINTTAAVHIISVKADIGSTVDEGVLCYAPLNMNFAEIGTIWRKGNAPAGFCLELAYCACILQTYLKANDLSICTLITQAVAHNSKAVGSLLKLEQGWRQFLPKKEFMQQFQETIPDQESRDMNLVSFYTPVSSSLLGAARCLLGLNENPKFSRALGQTEILQAYDYKSKSLVEIDLRGTELLATAKMVIKMNDALSLNASDNGLPWHAALKHFLASVNGGPTDQPHRPSKSAPAGAIAPPPRC